MTTISEKIMKLQQELTVQTILRRLLTEVTHSRQLSNMIQWENKKMWVNNNLAGTTLIRAEKGNKSKYLTLKTIKVKRRMSTKPLQRQKDV